MTPLPKSSAGDVVDGVVVGDACTVVIFNGADLGVACSFSVLGATLQKFFR